MTALDIHSRGGGDIRTPHTVEVLPRVVRHAAGRNAEGKSVFLSTDDDDDHHHHRELVNGDVDIEYAHENEVRTSQLLMHSTEQF